MDSSFNTIFIGKINRHLKETTSTNTYLQDWVCGEPGLPEGVLVSADYQTKGKGQRGKSWHSERAENVLISILLKPNWLPLDKQFYLTIAVSLGVVQFLETMWWGRFQIKWPNDIYYNRKKLGGILIENQTSAERLQQSIVGVGININQVSFPNNLPNPVSLGLSSGKNYSIPQLIEELCIQIEKKYLQLKSGAFEALKHDYLTHLYQFGENKLYQLEDEKLMMGTIVDVNETGQLVIDSRSGIKQFDFNEIRFRLG